MSFKLLLLKKRASSFPNNGDSQIIIPDMEFMIYGLEYVPLYYHEMLKAIAAAYS